MYSIRIDLPSFTTLQTHTCSFTSLSSLTIQSINHVWFILIDIPFKHGNYIHTPSAFDSLLKCDIHSDSSILCLYIVNISF